MMQIVISIWELCSGKPMVAVMVADCRCTVVKDGFRVMCFVVQFQIFLPTSAQSRIDCNDISVKYTSIFPRSQTNYI